METTATSLRQASREFWNRDPVTWQFGLPGVMYYMYLTIINLGVNGLVFDVLSITFSNIYMACDCAHKIPVT